MKAIIRTPIRVSHRRTFKHAYDELECQGQSLTWGHGTVMSSGGRRISICTSADASWRAERNETPRHTSLHDPSIYLYSMRSHWEKNKTPDHVWPRIILSEDHRPKLRWGNHKWLERCGSPMHLKKKKLEWVLCLSSPELATCIDRKIWLDDVPKPRH